MLEAVVVDPAWNVGDLLDTAEADGYRVVASLVTHYHPDHVGGDLWGVEVEGLAQLLERQGMPIYVNRHEGDGLRKVTPSTTRQFAQEKPVKLTNRYFFSFRAVSTARSWSSFTIRCSSTSRS